MSCNIILTWERDHCRRCNMRGTSYRRVSRPTAVGSNRERLLTFLVNSITSRSLVTAQTRWRNLKRVWWIFICHYCRTANTWLSFRFRRMRRLRDRSVRNGRLVASKQRSSIINVDKHLAYIANISEKIWDNLDELSTLQIHYDEWSSYSASVQMINDGETN